MAYIDDIATLDQDLDSLELEVSTVDANDAASGDSLYVNVVFTDGTRLYEPTNYTVESLPSRGKSSRFELPLPTGLFRKLGDIAEVYLRKSGDNGWFMGSVLLFANGLDDPLIGNRHANQFLDNDDDVLYLREWSTSSLCVAQTSEPRFPLARSGYRVLGPVLGQVSDTSAVVLYRVDREGAYKLRVVDSVTNVATEVPLVMEPTGRFELTGLEPDRRYDFDLRFVRAGVESIVPDSAGSLHTYPAADSLGLFSFAFGSCNNPDEQEAQGSWNGIRALAEAPPTGIEPVRLFVHLGDTFYFYDHMTDETVRNVESMHGAHVSMRRNIEFLDMARVVPSCAIWDDHDFAKDDNDSTDISSELRSQGVETWKQYWGNNQPISFERNHGLTTRISHGLVDIYLLDGRFNRDKDNGVCFGYDMIADLLQTIDERGAQRPRVVVLGTGSNWNHELDDNDEYYGDSVYDDEREHLFSELASRMGTTINGLILISGDDHINEIYHVDVGDRMAPEFLASPFTLNDPLKDANDIEGERVASFGTKGDDGKRGFATLTIDTSSFLQGRWRATVRYYQEAAAIQYESRSYIVVNGEFRLA